MPGIAKTKAQSIKPNVDDDIKGRAIMGTERSHAHRLAETTTARTLQCGHLHRCAACHGPDSRNFRMDPVTTAGPRGGDHRW
ncbi:hypothetical protein BRM83_07565, partial [Xanthomonas oryzae pv. oryzae]